MGFVPARGFVLSARPFGEADKIVQLYTLSLGRVTAMAKGARKPKSRVASSLELFTESSFSLHKRNSSGNFHVLGQAKVLNGHGNLKKDLGAITALQVLSDMLTQALQDGESHPEVYHLLQETLTAMEKDADSREILLAAFAVRFVDLLGHPLELEACAECGKSLTRKNALLVPHRGGALCGDCCATGPSRLKVSPSGLEILKKLRTLPTERIHVLRMKPAFSRGLFLTMLDFLERTIDKKLKTVDYYLTLSDKF